MYRYLAGIVCEDSLASHSRTCRWGGFGGRSRSSARKHGITDDDILHA